MDHISLIGLLAGTLTTSALLPQVIKTWKSRSAKDISAGMFVSTCAGLFLWIIYGFLISSTPVVVTNIVTFVLAATMLLLKIRFG